MIGRAGGPMTEPDVVEVGGLVPGMDEEDVGGRRSGRRAAVTLLAVGLVGGLVAGLAVALAVWLARERPDAGSRLRTAPQASAVDALAAARWAVGPVRVTPSAEGARVSAEITNLAEGVLREGVFTLVISRRDGERVAVVQGYAVLGPGETKVVDFPGTEDFLGRGGPYSYTFEVN